MADISKINAVLIANIAEIDDVLAANIAKVNGLVFSTAPAVGTPVAAYSVRLLGSAVGISSYTGDCIRIREDSGDTETDIGFDGNGDLDTAAIASHCGSANGYVVTWYDQAGSQVDATQSTTTRQPQIYNGTAVITENGKPAPQFTGDYFNLSLTNTASNYSLHVVTQNSSTNSFLFDSYTGRLVFDGRGGTRGVYYDGSWKGTMHSGTGQQLQSIYAISSSSGQSYVDGSQINTGLSYTQTAIGGNVTLGCEQTGTAFHISGTIQEFILYASDETSNRSGIETNINDHYLIGNFPNPTSGLLATYTGAAAAYSVRQLANTAALAMRIREDGTDTETDIGFDANGDLDTAAISSHCGANNGYVVTWYDQSGNQVDATQATTGSQPQIYNGTAVITENGKGAIQFDGTLDSLDYDLDTSLSAASYYHTFTVYQSSTTNSIYHGSRDTFAAYHFGLDGSTSTNLQGPMLSNKTTFNHFYKNGSQSFTSSTTRDQYFTEYFTGDQTLMAYMMTVDGGSSNTTQWHIGRNKETLYGVDGNIQEFIVYQTDQSSNQSGIETDINNYFSIY